MKKTAILMKEGFEEGKVITIADLLRRGGVQCDLVAFDDLWVNGMQNIKVKADKLFSPELMETYDLVVLPGGRPGGQNLMDDPQVTDMIRTRNEKGQLIGAIYFGTRLLAKAGVIAGKKVTGYTGYEEILEDEIWQDVPAVADQNLITGCGPATPYSFALEVLKQFGIDTSELTQRMMYASRA